MNTNSGTSNHEANQEFFDHHQNNPWPTQNMATPIFTSSLPPLHPNMPFMINHPFYNGGWNIDHHLGLASFYNPMQFGSFNGDQMPKMMSAEEVMDAKALAASKSHSEAERRRRERINVHLARLRSLLPNTTKTDKASLLAEVIQHVKELRRQTSEISEESPLPTESDELIVQSLNTNEDTINNDQKFIAKALLCCDDRPNLLPDLIKALKTLHLRTLKAEITTLGGRVRSVLVICGDEDFDCSRTDVSSIQDALKVVMERSSGFESELNGTKRQRVATNLFDHNSI